MTPCLRRGVRPLKYQVVQLDDGRRKCDALVDGRWVEVEVVVVRSQR